MELGYIIKNCHNFSYICRDSPTCHDYSYSKRKPNRYVFYLYSSAKEFLRENIKPEEAKYCTICKLVEKEIPIYEENN